MKWNIFILLINAAMMAFINQQTAAQTVLPAPPTPLPSPIASSKPHGPVSPSEIAEWHVQMAESTFSFDQNDRTRSGLVFAYERFLEATCFTELYGTLQFRGVPSGSRCAQVVDKLLALDAGNPVALCARHGIDNKLCRQASAQILFGTYEPGISLWQNDDLSQQVDLETKLDETSRVEAMTTLELTIQTQEQDLMLAQTPEDREAALKSLLEGYVKVFDQSCRIVRLKLENRTPATPTPIPTTPQEAIAAELATAHDEITPAPTPEPPNPLTDLAHVLSGGRPQEEARAELLGDFNRTRFFSPKCTTYLDKALGVDPKFAPALCIRFGRASPQCIDALRASKKKEPSSSGEKPQPGRSIKEKTGFKTF